ncbi:hypothetical protein PTTG_27515 [Puccinia triticina 1-1 BBBD Race 1]|uniref:Uncharacterized protein n=2 Tax=Puccinia triticina TaxID=208348 RepID=A0A180GJB8_PUCT1|nr:uncharacterized protein PtA15_14A272 [Puccinia triticina]OAV92876.1 hypothetical protein PTTG_27515 [Puccinia triticina 1-1 BBBD Race 1]WAQ91389.1 hypothetical protein PtA15_14A272 [Puccinia triticina]WAR62188.1 hypothetical protein PtB15_14B282 [Puccinia triticina]
MDQNRPPNHQQRPQDAQDLLLRETAGCLIRRLEGLRRRADAGGGRDLQSPEDDEDDEGQLDRMESGIERLQTELLPELARALGLLPRQLLLPKTTLHTRSRVFRPASAELDAGLRTIRAVGATVEQIVTVFDRPSSRASARHSLVAQAPDLRGFRREEIRAQTVALIHQLAEAFKALYYAAGSIPRVDCVARPDQGAQDDEARDEGEAEEWAAMNEGARNAAQALRDSMSRSDRAVLQSRWHGMARMADRTLARLAHLAGPARAQTHILPLVRAAVPVVKLARIFFNKLASPTSSFLASIAPNQLFGSLLPSTLQLSDSVNRLDFSIKSLPPALPRHHQASPPEWLRLTSQAFLHPLLLLLHFFQTLSLSSTNPSLIASLHSSHCWFQTCHIQVNLAFQKLHEIYPTTYNTL